MAESRCASWEGVIYDRKSRWFGVIVAIAGREFCLGRLQADFCSWFGMFSKLWMAGSDGCLLFRVLREFLYWWDMTIGIQTDRVIDLYFVVRWQRYQDRLVCNSILLASQAYLNSLFRRAKKKNYFKNV